MSTSPEAIVLRPVPAWRQKLSSFWRWWTEDLAQVAPQRFAALRGSGRVPQLAIEGDDLVLVEPKSAVASDSRIALATLDAARARQAVRSLLERAGESRERARLCLAHDEALLRRATMPAVTEENLRQVLGFEMDRLTPFRAEDVYFDFRVLSRDAGAGTLAVLLAVARRELVDARVAVLRSLGVSVQGVTVRDDASHAGSQLDLLPLEQRGERETSRERLINRSLMAAVVLLLGVALLFPVWRKRETVKALLPILAKAQAEAQATDAVARELERQVADYNFLLAKKHAWPPALAYLEEVTRLLPDNTWVQQFDLKSTGKARELQITGETASSSKLLEILERSTLLQNAATRGATVTSGPNSQRFMIVAEPRPRQQPDARGVGDAAAIPPAPPPAAAPPAAAPPAAAQPTTATQAAKVEPVAKPADAPAKKPAAPGK
jgi:general secretion pathway protein L